MTFFFFIVFSHAAKTTPPSASFFIRSASALSFATSMPRPLPWATTSISLSALRAARTLSTPMFLTRDRDPRLAIVDWGHNAWGGKYPPFDLDDVVPTRIAEALSVPVYDGSMILEGGSIDVNGSGACITTESCLLNPNRNPDMQENLAGLEEIRVDGEPLKIVKLPTTAKMEREDLVLPTSYANFYIADEVVLVPTFADANDAAAVATIQAAFPDRRVSPIDCHELIWGLGAFHCLTQQQPAVA